MGCHASVFCEVSNNCQSSRSNAHWIRIPSEVENISRFKADGTLKEPIDKIQLEFRLLLSYKVAIPFLQEYLQDRTPYLKTCFDGWCSIQTFNDMTDGPARVTLASCIFRNYIESNASVARVNREIANMLISHPERLKSGVFSESQYDLFSVLVEKMFADFQGTEQYVLMCNKIRHYYNFVEVDDFAYSSLIGTGAFGTVCEVRKISTGVKYAMKLQRKSTIIEHYSSEVWRVEYEKRALMSCKHPFIISMSFAFETNSLYGLVMELGTGPNLEEIQTANGPFQSDQVLFYTAEITSALSYLHFKGLIYRDLKPGNVLLNADGHIQLVDFGAVCAMDGQSCGLNVGTITKSVVLGTSPGTVLSPSHSQRNSFHMDYRNPLSFESSLKQNGSSGNSYGSFNSGGVTGGVPSLVDFTSKGTGANASTANAGVKQPSSPSVSSASVATGTMTAPTPSMLPRSFSNRTTTLVRGSGRYEPKEDVPSYSNVTYNATAGMGAFNETTALDTYTAEMLPMFQSKSFDVQSAAHLAPELLLLMLETEGIGYTKAVDWWSLGMLMFKLLTGEDAFVTVVLSTNTDDKKRISSQRVAATARYACLQGELSNAWKNHSNVTPDSLNFIQKLLTFQDTNRLGYGSNGSENISLHGYFKTIPWCELDKKKHRPPPLPKFRVKKGSQDWNCGGNSVSFDTFLKQSKLTHYQTNPDTVEVFGGTVVQFKDANHSFMSMNWQESTSDAVNAELAK